MVKAEGCTQAKNKKKDVALAMRNDKISHAAEPPMLGNEGPMHLYAS